MRKKQGDKAKQCKQKVANKSLKKQKILHKRVVAKNNGKCVVIEVNVNVK